MGDADVLGLIDDREVEWRLLATGPRNRPATQPTRDAKRPPRSGGRLCRCRVRSVGGLINRHRLDLVFGRIDINADVAVVGIGQDGQLVKREGHL